MSRALWWRFLRAYVVAIVWISVVEAGLRLRPLPVLARWLGVPLDSTRSKAPPPPEVEEQAFGRGEWIRVRAIDRAISRWPFGDTCLRRSLVWGHALRGRAPKLRIGVARSAEGAVIAHSWLEFDGVSLGLDPDTDYQPLGWR